MTHGEECSTPIACRNWAGKNVLLHKCRMALWHSAILRQNICSLFVNLTRTGIVSLLNNDSEFHEIDKLDLVTFDLNCSQSLQPWKTMSKQKRQCFQNAFTMSVIVVVVCLIKTLQTASVMCKIITELRLEVLAIPCPFQKEVFFVQSKHLITKEPLKNLANCDQPCR